MALPAGSYSPFGVAYLDAGNEIGRMQGYGEELTAENFDDQADLFATFLTACDGITLGARQSDHYNDETLYVVSQPTNGANRETKLLVQMQNTISGRKFTFSVPTLDPDPANVLYVVNANAKDVVRLDAPAGIVTFIGATNAFVRDPNQSGSACAVIGLRVVGRNN